MAFRKKKDSNTTSSPEALQKRERQEVAAAYQKGIVAVIRARYTRAGFLEW
jgi:hypothetical protein